MTPPSKPSLVPWRTKAKLSGEDVTGRDVGTNRYPYVMSIVLLKFGSREIVLKGCFARRAACSFDVGQFDDEKFNSVII
jgi:hypothetical protein